MKRYVRLPIGRAPADLFNYERMVGAMAALHWPSWTYLGHRPTVEDLKAEVQFRFEEMRRTGERSYRSGGLVVFADGSVAFDGRYFDNAQEIWDSLA